LLFSKFYLVKCFISLNRIALALYKLAAASECKGIGNVFGIHKISHSKIFAQVGYLNLSGTASIHMNDMLHLTYILLLSLKKSASRNLFIVIY